MSYTEIYIIRENKDVELIGQVQNAHRGAYLVWLKLKDKYNIQDESFSFKNTWKLFNSGKLTEYENISLGTTFDDVIVLKEDMLSVINAFNKFRKEHDCNLDKQAEIIKNILNEKDCFGMCWNQTSVCADTWQFYPQCEHEEERLYNLDKDSEGKYWNLFKELSQSSKDKREE